jgi:hypothetical protein
MELQHDNWVKFLNAILRKMTVKIEVIFIGGRTGNIFVRWPNMFPYLGIEILRSLKSYTTWIEGNWWSSGNEISRCNASLQNPNGFTCTITSYSHKNLSQNSKCCSFVIPFTAVN